MEPNHFIMLLQVSFGEPIDYTGLEFLKLESAYDN